MRFNPASFKHLDQMRRVFLDVGSVAGNIGDREEFAQLADNAVFVSHAIVAHFLRDLCRRRRRRLLRQRAARQKGHQQRDRYFFQKFAPPIFTAASPLESPSTGTVPPAADSIRLRCSLFCRDLSVRTACPFGQAGLLIVQKLPTPVYAQYQCQGVPFFLD